MKNWASPARPDPSNMGPRGPWAGPTQPYCIDGPGLAWPLVEKGGPARPMHLHQVELGQPTGPWIGQDGLTHDVPNLIFIKKMKNN